MATRRDAGIGQSFVAQLPPGITLSGVTEYVHLRVGSGQAWGETHLMLHGGRLVILTRRSVMDRYVAYEAAGPPAIVAEELKTELVIATTDGATHRFPITRRDEAPVEKLLANLRAAGGD